MKVERTARHHEGHLDDLFVDIAHISTPPSAMASFPPQHAAVNPFISFNITTTVTTINVSFQLMFLDFISWLA